MLRLLRLLRSAAGFPNPGRGRRSLAPCRRAPSHTPAPPRPAPSPALTSLRLIGALDASPAGALTPLGQHLTRMPCDPRIGKMLLYGCLLRCLDPVLTIAAAQGWGRPVFWSTPDKREEVRAGAGRRQHRALGRAAGQQRAAEARGTPAAAQRRSATRAPAAPAACCLLPSNRSPVPACLPPPGVPPARRPTRRGASWPPPWRPPSRTT